MAAERVVYCLVSYVSQCIRGLARESAKNVERGEGGSNLAVIDVTNGTCSAAVVSEMVTAPGGRMAYQC